MQNSSKKTLISIKNVGICFKKQARLSKGSNKKVFWALQDVTFDIYRNETLGIIGRNGAGKSTILATIGDIYEPDRGEVKNWGCKVSLLSLRAGFVPYLSGRKNIVLNGLILGSTKKEIMKDIDKIIEFSELGDFIDEPVVTYSSGMSARLGFSTALFMNPDLILIDEVLGVGDINFRKKSTEAIKSKLTKNLSAVLCSHSEPTIRELCQRVVWLEKGKVELVGTPDEVFEVYNKRLNVKN